MFKILYPKILKIQMDKDHTDKGNKFNRKTIRIIKIKEIQKSKPSEKKNQCSKKENSMKFLNSQLLHNTILSQNIWFSLKEVVYWVTLMNLMMHYFFTLNRSVNYWRVSGYFIRQRHWWYFRRFYRVLEIWWRRTGTNTLRRWNGYEKYVVNL